MRSALVTALSVTATLAAAAGIGLASPAQAGTALCYDERLCGDLGDVSYCPDSGKMVGPFAPCPSLVTGPYAPGGLRPNAGLSSPD
ncbi:hypothetical protein AWC18_13915 [Mycolicibacter nonchromogenicus]|uniref:Intersectin-EH binding protein Ibp1 n=1 Tax=Mycolicibacter nonchromogenicus TaxID=1782 RepID=A0A1X1Z8X1_MYCNO|nr:hypothetical protein [Mycolicibacter nonchromogenicus]OBI06021.1 hypothetical protein A5715_21040 [Mycolicibacter heraklionensis]ORW19660.1 hypothetical protein AWC18_13915 [Mycolicibacter nonchromogenicus]